MTKINKRVLALLMALVLMFSCTAFASAATPESTVPELTYEAAPDAGGIMPRAFQQLTNAIGGTSPNYSDEFRLNSTSYVTIVLTSNAPEVIVTLRKNDGGYGFASRTIQPADGQNYYTIGSDKLPAGKYSFTVSVPGGAQTTFAFAATDYTYPRQN